MADAAVEFLLSNLQNYLNSLREGEEVVKWIEYELETLIPQLERVEGLPEQNDSWTGTILKEKSLAQQNDLRYMIHKAEVLAETYTKMVTQRNDSNNWKPINSMEIPLISRKLHKIRNRITRARDEFSSHARELSQWGALEDHPPSKPTVPTYLSRCVHYFLLFPPDFQVPARRLIALWVAEGLIRSKRHEVHSVEKIGLRYIDELTDLGLIHVNHSRSGKVKTCRMDRDSRDSMLEEAKKAAEDKKANFFQDTSGKIRRLVDHNGKDDASFIHIDGDTNFSRLVRTYKDVISFLSFNEEEGSKPGENIGDFLRECISAGCFVWLNVLDLEKVFRPKLPPELGALISLKYLGLRWTYLEQLPDTVNRLFSLQVLDVKHTYISVLPRSIWSMEYLRHLYLSEAYRTRFPVPPSKVTLTALQTLWGAFVDEETRVAGGLDRLLNIRKLGLSCRLTDYAPAQQESETEKKWKAIEKWISKLKHLESLRLKSRDVDGDAACMHLTSLEENKSLSTVYLLGKLVFPTILCQFPVSLTDITLSGSELEFDPMGFLGRLPNLIILRLLAKSVVCNTIHCSKIGFLKLKHLWIWKLENLEEFEADEGSLPSLEELEVRSCHKLEKLPDRLRQLENLEVKLTSMEQEFMDREWIKYADIQPVSEDQLILRNKPARFSQYDDTKGKQPLSEPG